MTFRKIERKNEKSLFVDCYDIVTREFPDYFIYFFIGGRQIGKTYSMLKGFVENKDMFLYMRRTDVEEQAGLSEEGNPFKSINRDLGTNIYLGGNKKSGGTIIKEINEEEKQVIGYTGALSTFGNMRGVDYTDCDYIYIDEFINMKRIDYVKNDGSLLFDSISTVNRNRELLGQDAIKIVLTSNANTIDSDIIRTLYLDDIIYQMKEKCYNVYTDEERGIYLELMETPKKLKQKLVNTKLAKLTRGTRFYDMAFENNFTTDYFGDISKKVDYSVMYPVCAFEDIYFYKYKYKELMFASKRKAQCTMYNEQTKEAFKRDFGFMMMNYIETGRMLYRDYNTKLTVQHIWKG